MANLVKIIFLFSISVTTFAGVCPEGVWDLGKNVVSLSFTCESENQGVLRFCKREYYINTGLCNHIGAPLSCKVVDEAWICEEPGYRSQTTILDENRIKYEFTGSFSNGEFIGTKLKRN
jgi:hypothetical protein